MTVEDKACPTCNGRREIGGWVGGVASIDGGGGYETQPCPDCSEPSPTLAWTEVDTLTAARAHYEQRTTRHPHEVWARWATWEQACEAAGWLDEQLTAMRAALSTLPSPPPAKPDEEGLRRAYLRGFRLSAEGYNGEYPFDKDDAEIERLVGPNADAYLATLRTPSKEQE